MSLENLKKFGELCDRDVNVLAKVKEIGMDSDAVIKYAAEEHLLEFTPDDMIELAKIAGNSSDELDEEDLDKIAGGFFTASAVLAVGMVGVAILAGLGVTAAIKATAAK